MYTATQRTIEYHANQEYHVCRSLWWKTQNP